MHGTCLPQHRNDNDAWHEHYKYTLTLACAGTLTHTHLHTPAQMWPSYCTLAFSTRRMKKIKDN